MEASVWGSRWMPWRAVIIVWWMKDGFDCVEVEDPLQKVSYRSWMLIFHGGEDESWPENRQRVRQVLRELPVSRECVMSKW